MKLICTFLAILLYCLNLNAQITLGSDIEPKKGTLLDLKENNNTEANSSKGLGLPRVRLDSLTITGGNINLATTINGADISSGTVWDIKRHVGLTVYNVNKGDACEGTPEGVYTWNGSKWDHLYYKKLERPALSAGTDSYYGANTYIVEDGDSVYIPVKRAFDIWRDYTGTDVASGKILDKSIFPNFNNPKGHMSVKVVWEETENGSTTTGSIINRIGLRYATLGSGENEFITVSVVDKAYGNALIALMVDDIVIWQWQIWVPKNNPTLHAYPYDTQVAVYWFMDRYLGAISTQKQKWDGDQDGENGTNILRSANGLYYQWGRPTPMRKFGISIPDYTPVIGDEVGNMRIALQTPNFIESDNEINIAGNITTLDWYSDTPNLWGTRWGDGTLDDTGGKTAFDPCPEGWRVPAWKGSRSPWHCLENSEKLDYTTYSGYDFTDIGRKISYYPAAGYRVRTSGFLYDVGLMGPVWSATPVPAGDGVEALRLYTQKNMVRPQSKHYMANGLQVRCVQDN